MISKIKEENDIELTILKELEIIQKTIERLLSSIVIDDTISSKDLIASINALLDDCHNTIDLIA